MDLVGDTPWKAHERAVAKHFGTEREKRGADFSVSDCDVLVNIDDWYESRRFNSTGALEQRYTHLVVECKYRADLKLHQWMREFSKGVPRGKTPVLFWDSPGNPVPEYGICWMEDFDTIWVNWMHDELFPISTFASYWQVGYVKRKSPTYLGQWWDQAHNYCCELQRPPEERHTSFRASDERVLRQECIGYPLISVRANKLKGRLMVWKLWWSPGDS